MVVMQVWSNDAYESVEQSYGEPREGKTFISLLSQAFTLHHGAASRRSGKWAKPCQIQALQLGQLSSVLRESAVISWNLMFITSKYIISGLIRYIVLQ